MVTQESKTHSNPLIFSANPTFINELKQFTGLNTYQNSVSGTGVTGYCSCNCNQAS